MTVPKGKQKLPQLSNKEKLGAIICSFALLLIAVFTLYEFDYLTFNIFNRIYSGSYYVEATKIGAFLISGALIALCLIYLMCLRVLDKLTYKMVSKVTKIFSIIAFIGIGCSIIMWPIVNYQLDKHNYSYCFFYTGSNMFSPPVYVKDSKYCFKSSRSVRQELFAWFDQQEEAGVEVQPIEVLKKIQELKQEKGTDW
ncbi:MAG: hypothetical protein CMP47_01205 [Rickettsiales bacterium]|nr:hypothetical protein [Rickettsiales bacterium]